MWDFSGTGLDNKEDEGLWIQYAITLAFLTGLFQILMGVCRCTFLTSPKL
jgi:MFS superfamily sulfate permease-like transporter